MSAEPVPGTASPNFGARLLARMGERSPLCVGVDPHPALLASWGLPDNAAGLADFSARVLEACGPLVAALKPQVALFERHGSRGLTVLEELLERSRAAGVLTIADAKRGDIGSTMTAYAQAWLEPDSPLCADALTVSPYLGFGSLEPAFELAEEHGKGVFVLALTSNPEGASVQHARTTTARPRAGQGKEAEDAVASESVAGNILARAFERNAAQLSDSGARVGSTGLVVGATIKDAAARLGMDLAGFNGIFLVPGFGAQGASAQDLKSVFGADQSRVLVNSSRAILGAGPEPEALRGATQASITELLG